MNPCKASKSGTMTHMHKIACCTRALLLMLGVAGLAEAQLSVDFYNTSCPNVDSIVRNAMASMHNQSNVVSPSTLRLLVHDCFVEGCDASILISSTGNNTAERDAPDNNIPQVAFDAVIQAKEAVEAACPRIVSCADILAMAARDAVVLTGGPHWDVPKGRRDGLVSQASRVAGHLPGADFNVSQLVESFAQVNLTAADMVVLSGGHTIGFTHCARLASRLYNFSGANMTDPSMNASLANSLKLACPRTGGEDPVQALDVNTPFTFDNLYYKQLQLGQGLLFADQVLFSEDSATRAVVNQLADSQEAFFTSFASAMVKMSNIGVRTGQDGEVRLNCSQFNSNSSNVH